METEHPVSAAAKRPNPVLLILLGIAVAAYGLNWLAGSAGRGAPASNLRNAPPAAAEAFLDPALLDVRLESLSDDRPGFGEFERNPFRFQARAAGPASGGGSVRAHAVPPPVAPLPEPQTPAVPPITVRFIGLVDRQDGTKVAVFVDCTVGRRTSHAQQGGIVDGRYRLVQVGLQSVVIEHLDGRGRTTLPLTGQDCVGR